MRSMIVARRLALERLRLGVQAVSTLLLNLRVAGVSLLSCPAPVMNCHSCPAASLACPVGLVVNFSASRLVPFFTIGVLGLTGLVAGRLTCGWVCPFGLLQDLVARCSPVKRKLWIPRQLGALRYAALAGLVVLFPLVTGASEQQGALNFCSFCPVGGVEATIPALVRPTAGSAPAASASGAAPIGAGGAVKLIAVAALLLAAAVTFRPFCRVVCPIGLVLDRLAPWALVRLRVDRERCTSCGACARACTVGVDPASEAGRGGRDGCVMCLDCTRRCPQQAISLKIG